MAQTFTSTDVVSTTNVFGDNQSQRVNENTLRSNFSGATQPSDPVVGQQWYDTANSKTWQYNGTAWVPIDTNSTTQVDVSNAKGNLTTLTNYLRVAHNDDGTLKTSPATAIDEFKDNALVITYVSTSSFTVPTDLTSIFTVNRKLKVYLSASTAITYVSSSSYNSGTNVTTVVTGGAVLDSSVTSVKFSIIQYGERQDTMHQSDMTAYAPLASPALTGVPTAPTATSGTSTTQIATTEFVGNAVNNVQTPVTFNSFQAIKILVTGNTALTITANNNPYANSGSTSLSIATSTSGAGGIDTGTIAASTWYFVYIIYGISGTSSIISLNSSAPALPTGYTKYVRVGSVKTDSSIHLLTTIQYGRKVQYTSPVTIVSGTNSSFTGTVVSAVTVPSTSCAIKVKLFTNAATGTNFAACAPNNTAYAIPGTAVATSPPICSLIGTSIAPLVSVMGDFLLESTSVYYYSNNSSTILYCMGWEDNL